MDTVKMHALMSFFIGLRAVIHALNTVYIVDFRVVSFWLLLNCSHPRYLWIQVCDIFSVFIVACNSARFVVLSVDIYFIKRKTDLHCVFWQTELAVEIHYHCFRVEHFICLSGTSFPPILSFNHNSSFFMFLVTFNAYMLNMHGESSRRNVHILKFSPISTAEV